MLGKLCLHWFDIARSTRIAPGWTLNSISCSCRSTKLNWNSWHSRTQLRCVRVLSEMHSRAQWRAFACSIEILLHSRDHWNWNVFAFTCPLKLKCFCIRVLHWIAFVCSIEMLLHSYQAQLKYFCIRVCIDLIAGRAASGTEVGFDWPGLEASIWVICLTTHVCCGVSC